jgi:hypothetical protein
MQQIQQTRVIWYVMAALLVLLGGGAIAAGTKKGTGSAGKGGRAVVVPTADRARTVVVPPCATGEAVTSLNATQQAGTTGSTRVTIPQAPGTRVVVVPPCPTKVGGTLPSAAFVIEPGARVPAKGDKNTHNPVLQDLRSEVIVPQNSPASTIVVPPCAAKATKGSSAVVGQGSSATVVAPPC